jgi:membrane associated rhomboid family serine protease
MPNPPPKDTAYPFLTAALVVLSLVAFFVWQLGFGVDEAVAEAGFPPKDWAAGAPHRREHFALATFMHGGVFHVLANMSVLWLFGARLERLLGPWKFALLYLLAAYAGLRAHVLFAPKSLLPMVGAGSAISGVLGAWLMLHRRRGLDFLLPGRAPHWLAPVPVWTAAPLWLGLQALSHRVSTAHHGGIGAFAELVAGLVAGVGASFILKPGNRRGPPIAE